MKIIQNPLLLAVVFILSAATARAGVAEVHLANESLLVHSGRCSCGFGLVWTMYFSTSYTEEPTQLNEEISPLLQPASFHYWTYLVLEDPSMVASATYAELDLPTGDANHNSIPDFFEVSRAINGSSIGTYAISWGIGQLAFDWTRAAGSRVGTMVLTLQDPILGTLGPFTHTFELLRYTGQLTYTPGSNRITGTISLVKDGQASEWLSGPVTIAKTGTNRFNQLTLTAGNWTSPSGTFSFGDSEFTRDPAYPTLYQGSLQYPGGSSQHWKLLITDPNDANGNGIPDFSDDLSVIAPLRRPLLSLSLTSSNLLLRVSGDVGLTNLIQRAASLSATNWTTIQNLVLTSDPQIVVLPLPVVSPQFWRVQVP